MRRNSVIFLIRINFKNFYRRLPQQLFGGGYISVGYYAVSAAGAAFSRGYSFNFYVKAFSFEQVATLYGIGHGARCYNIPLHFFSLRKTAPLSRKDLNGAQFYII